MQPNIKHSWNLPYKEAVCLQKKLASKVKQVPIKRKIKKICGLDISCSKKSDMLYATTVILDSKNLTILETSSNKGKATFPYIPGLLSFREIPLLRQCLLKLKNQPDIIIADGQGIAHPRKFGLASHIGILYNIPSIGCAKSVLVGEYKQLKSKKGSTSPLIYKGETIGTALRTKNNVKPVFVSVGNLITIQNAVRITLDCCTKYRIPEPTRQAHILVNNLRKEQSVDLKKKVSYKEKTYQRH